MAEFQDSVGSFSNLTEKDLLVWQNDTKGQECWTGDEMDMEDHLETKSTLQRKLLHVAINKRSSFDS